MFLAEAQEKAKSTLETMNIKANEIIGRANESSHKILTDSKAEATEVLMSAQQKSTELLTNAKDSYDTQMGALRTEVAEQESILENLKTSSTQLKNSLKEVYKIQLERLDDIPSFNLKFAEATDDEQIKTLDEYIENNEAFKEENQVKNLIGKSEQDSLIDEYVDDQEDYEQSSDDIHYEPLELEYVSDEDEEYDKNNNPQNSKTAQIKAEGNTSEYDDDIQEVFEEDEDDFENSSEDIGSLEVNTDDVYTLKYDEDDTVSELRNKLNKFNKEPQTQN